MNVLIATLGSHGDAHPFIGIAAGLRRQGHHVTVIAPQRFESLARKMDLDFAGVGTEEQFERIERNPDLWNSRRAFNVVAEGVAEMNETYFDAIVERNVPGRTVAVISTLVFGGRIAQEKFGIPTVSVHLSPSIFRSCVAPAYTPPLPVLAGWPRWNRCIFRLIDVAMLDRLLAPPINRLRRKLGLSSVKNIFDPWVHSPQRVIGLFPDWFGRPQPDWPRQTVCTGFPLYDESDVTPADEKLEAFLKSGSPPIAFTPGSSNRHARGLFETAVRICQVSGRRGLLLTRFAENIPADLPAYILRVPYAPFGKVFPRCAAIVHHGGIGTSAQALAAGRPQLVTPMAHDQPDNARRLAGLGVAGVIPIEKFSSQRGTKVLNQLLNDARVQTECVKLAQKMRQSDAIGETVRIIESVSGSGDKNASIDRPERFVE